VGEPAGLGLKLGQLELGGGCGGLDQIGPRLV